MDKNDKRKERKKVFLKYRTLIKVLKGILRFELCCSILSYLDSRINDGIILLASIVNVIFIIAILICIDVIFESIKHAKVIEYNFDYEKEKSTFLNMNSQWRKLKKGAKSCETYSEWKVHVHETFDEEIKKDSVNFNYYIKRKLRNNKERRHVFELVFIPLLIGALTIFFSLFKIPEPLDNISLFSGLIALFVALAFSEVYIVYSIYQMNDDIDFLEEFSKVLFP